MVRSVFATVVRTAVREGPCAISSISSANVTISRFGALFSTIRSLIIMFHRVGPKTDPCRQPLVTCLELAASPSLM